nr:hypothetical protein [Tanacetum cinerariifolium]
MLFSFGVDAIEDFKEYMLRDYYCLLKTYCCWFWLKLLDNAVVQIVSDVQIVSAASIAVNTVSSNDFGFYPWLLTLYISLRDKDLQKSKDPQVPVAHTTAEQRLAKKNELKARGTLLMALPDKHQLKFNIHKDAKSLMEDNEKWLGGNKETKKVQKTFLKQQYENFIGSKEMDLKWHMAMLNMRARRFLQRTGRNLGANETTSIGFDMSKVECYNYHRRGHFEKKCRLPRDTRNKDTQRRNVLVETSTYNALVSQCDGIGSYYWSFQTNEEPTNYALMAFTSLSSSSSDNENEHVLEEDIKLLELDVMLRDNALVELRKKFKKAEQERDDSDSDVSMPPSPVHDRYQSGEGYHVVPPPYTKTFMPPKPDMVFHDAPTANETVPTVLNVELSTTKPNKDLSSVKPVEHPIPVENLKKNIPKSRGHRHSWNRKACFVCKSFTHLIKDCDYYKKKMVQKPAKNHAIRENHPHYARMTHPHPYRHVVPTTVLTRSRIIPLNVARLVSTVVLKTNVKPHRPAKQVVNKAHSLIRRLINLRPSPKNCNFHQKVTTVKTNQGNPHHALKDKGVIDSGCSRHMTGNISYLSDFEEINRGYVFFGGNPKGGKITSKGSLKNNMYNVDLKNIVPSGDLTCLFAKATLYESNLWHRRLGYINFKTMNKLVKGNLVRGLPTKVFENNHTCVACKKGKKHRASCKSKPISSVSKPLQRVLVTKPHNKTPYELLLGRIPSIGFMRPFGCPVTILNTLDPLGKFNRKANEGFLVGYSSINYQPVVTRNQSNSSAGIQEHFDEGKAGEGNVQQYVLFPLWSIGSKDPQNTDADTIFEVKGPESKVHVSPSSSAKIKKHDDKTKREARERVITNGVNAASTPVTAAEPNLTNSTNTVTTVGPSNNPVSSNFKFGGKSSFVDPSQYHNDPNMPALEDITYSDDEEDGGAEDDFSNLDASITVSPIPTSRVLKDHPVTQIIIDLSLAPQTRSMTRMVKDQGRLTQINDEDFYTCMFSCFLSQEEPKRVHQALEDPSWIEAMQEELLQFKMQKGHPQEEGIDYEEVFAPVARIEAIRLFLAYASFMGFMVYPMDVKSAFLYGTIEEEVYVCQPLGFEDPDYLDKVYKVVKALYGLHQAPRAWFETLDTYLLENSFQWGKIDQTLFIKRKKGDILLVQVYVDDIIFGSTNKELCKAFKKLMKDKFQMSSMGELTFFLGLQVKQKEDGIFISKDKYVAEILRKFGFTNGKLTSTPIDTKKPLPRILMSSVSLKKINDVVRLQALIDRRKVIITGDMVRQALRLNDADSIDCLPNEEIFAELARMGYEKPSIKLTFYKVFFSAQWKFIIHTILQCISTKRTAWNEFSSSMASAIICLATVQDDVADAVEDKDAANDISAEPTPPLPTPATTPPPQQELIPSPSQVESTPPPSPHQSPITQLSLPTLQQPSQPEDISHSVMALLNQLLETCATLTKKVGTLEQDKIAQAIEITKLKQRVRRLEKKRKLKASGFKRLRKTVDVHGRLPESKAQVYHLDLEHAHKVLITINVSTPTAATTITAAPVPKARALRRRRSVIIQDHKEETTASEFVQSEVKSKDKGMGILVEESKPLKRQAQIEHDEAFARELEAELNANINWNEVIEQVKKKERKDNTVIRYQALKRKPVTEAQSRKNVMVYLKNMAGFKMDFFKAKKQKIDEETEELKTHLQIIPNDEDDMYTKATPLALKVPVVDYQIHTEQNKPYYKIIRADGTHQLLLSFISLLRNFDREDLEML